MISMRTLFPDWNHRCTARWLLIGGGALILAAVALLSLTARADRPVAVLAAVGEPPPPPPGGLGTSPSKPNGRVVLALGGLSTSPSDPVAPASTQWYASAASVLIMLIGLAKKSPRVEKFFATDGAGMLSSFIVSAAYTFGEALTRGESPSWVLAKHALTLTAAMFLGYAGILKRIVMPLGRQLAKALGIEAPSWLKAKGQA